MQGKHMKQTLLRALLMLDENENSWLSSGGFNESIDSHLIDVENLGIDARDVERTLGAVAEQAPDVLLMDSTLAWHWVLRIALRVRAEMPHLSIVLLPEVHGPGEKPDRDAVAADSIARTIRYTHGRLELQRILLQMALRDELTGLHNRRGFTALATQHIKWARDMGQRMVLFFADLDGLKSINDRFGHAEGDRAISLAAASIKRTFRKSDVTGRLSGDEFVALIPEEPGRGAEAICERLRINLADCAGGETRYKMSLSVGAACFDPGTPVTLQELMKQADAALYRRKDKNRTLPADRLAAASREGPVSVHETCSFA
jgi:diguanylate cyclase (GGDEF)-like protein